MDINIKGDSREGIFNTIEYSQSVACISKTDKEIRKSYLSSLLEEYDMKLEGVLESQYDKVESKVKDTPINEIVAVEPVTQCSIDNINYVEKGIILEDLISQASRVPIIENTEVANGVFLEDLEDNTVVGVIDTLESDIEYVDNGIILEDYESDNIKEKSGTEIQNTQFVEGTDEKISVKDNDYSDDFDWDDDSEKSKLEDDEIRHSRSNMEFRRVGRSSRIDRISESRVRKERPSRRVKQVDLSDDFDIDDIGDSNVSDGSEKLREDFDFDMSDLGSINKNSNRVVDRAPEDKSSRDYINSKSYRRREIEEQGIRSHKLSGDENSENVEGETRTMGRRRRVTTQRQGAYSTSDKVVGHKRSQSGGTERLQERSVKPIYDSFKEQQDSDFKRNSVSIAENKDRKDDETYSTVREYVKKHPGCTSVDIRKYFTARDLQRALMASKVVEKKGKYFVV